LGEAFGLFNVANIGITLIGIVLIVKPPSLFGSDEAVSSSGLDENDDTSNKSIWGPVAAILSAIFGANALIFIRLLRDVHQSVVMCNFGFFAMLYTLLVLFLFGSWCLPPCEDRLLVVALALFSFGGQMLLTMALRFEEASIIAISRSTTILFAFLWQIIFFHQMPCVYSIFGAVLIVLSVGVSAAKKWALSNDTNVSRNLSRILRL
jgi:drug/metabolite transporter (DMT)-like permease